MHITMALTVLYMSCMIAQGVESRKEMFLISWVIECVQISIPGAVQTTPYHQYFTSFHTVS